ncbi:syntaxin-binding protein 5-like isoform X3 [Lytechinus pictus]|uniref:syntaxin-binding protein 5-like isoform X3 n=1 Tax=Lytechinus pictus TaxID=7653 RepID=UPI0030BA1B7A
MKRLVRVLDGLTAGVGSSSSPKDSDVVESLTPEHFNVCKVVRHGFPFEPTAMAYDPVQNILAVGSKNGSMRIFGRPGVDCHVRHDSDTAVLQLMFLVNEGALVSVCADDSLHLWNLRQKRPAILHSLKFNRERITYCDLPFQSKWLYIGTERGNVHVVNIESFSLSGYVINWNKAIELSRKTHPGPVVHLSDNPVDGNKLLIGFETGAVVLWDLKTRVAEYRYNCSQPVRSIAWHYEGKQFVCSHMDGTLTIWNVKNCNKPANIISPHAKVPAKGLKPEPCAPVPKVEWASVKSGDPYILFSGGLTYEKATQTPSITIMQGKTTTVLEMEHSVVDFLTLCENPWPSNPQEPYAVVVLLESDLVVVDLLSPGYPCFENPYPMDLHESPITCVQYYADCPSDLIPALYSTGANGLNRKKTAYSKRNWPVKGGEWGSGGSSDQEIIITGHADGSIKFWDASQVMLQVLYKLKTAKVFEKAKQAKTLDGDDDPFAIQLVKLCSESRMLCVAGASGHLLLYRFSKMEASTELPTLEISIVYEAEEPETPETEMPPMPIQPAPLKRNTSTVSASSVASATLPSTPIQQTSTTPAPSPINHPHHHHQHQHQQQHQQHQHHSHQTGGEGLRDNVPNLRVKGGAHKRGMGFQPSLCVQLLWVDGEPPPTITCVEISSAYGLLAFGTTNGLAIVDYLQRTCLLNMGTPDLYGSADPYQRTPRSPKKNKSQPQGLGDIVEQYMSDQERCRSPVGSSMAGESNGVCISPTGNSAMRGGGGGGGGGVKPRNNHDPSQLRRTPKVNGVSHPEHPADPHQTSPCPSTPPQPPKQPPPRPPPPRPPPPNTSPSTTTSETAHKPVSATNSFSSTTTRSSSSNSLSSNPALSQTNQSSGDPPPQSDACHKKSSVPRFRLLVESVVASISGKHRSEGSFTRSRSSSMSSLEKETREGVQNLVFSESYTRKEESVTCPCLWVGTTLGSVLGIVVNLPPPGEQRLSQPVIVTPSGTVFRLKGCTLHIAFLDCNGLQVPPACDVWRDPNKETREGRDKKPLLQRSRMSPSSSTEIADRQFVVICSEKEAKVISLPSQTCVYRTKISESSYVVRSDVISMQNSVCLACYVANGHIMTYSLPSFRLLLDKEYLPLTDLRIGRTFQFSSHGKGLYQCSPTEIQRFTICSEASENLHDMLGDLFLPVNTPEAPSKGFFKGLFGGGGGALDREELFGETAGKPSKSVARHIPGTGGLEGVKAQAGGAMGEVAKARIALYERGQKLSELEEKTAQMMANAENFQQAANQIMQKYKDKKWYQF